ncbi:hypothetical protein B0O41_2491 [Propionibacteriaceae bacterium ES.041]|uniref:hypothetical protein n=1 Tax=Enemella evansiae TaxID=2016499 RepID=UPI000B97BFA9|nr:hypothetical protein [Enemella evansiae]OYN94606.1 hypothetical protein CGZ96_17160 [Enemella evansiae]OYO05135.1 hypothetical protein CGZ95_02265 [Enemella evansiae]PFG67671.1 hypothetical protein B0O41_2491 [Propionibacteriaceae bacterium ES.041]
MTDWNLDDDDGAWDGLGAPGPEPEEQTDDWPGELTSDPSGAVRVGVDEDHRVVRVVISNNWRNKVKPDLAAAVHGAARVATEPLSLGAIDTPSFNLLAGRRPQPQGTVLDHPMSQYEVNQLLEKTLQAFEKQDRLAQRDDVRPREYRYEPAVGQSDNEKVSVQLDLQMRPEKVTIDEQWASGARVERIVTALHQAFARAYQNWREPVVIKGEYDELQDEVLDLRKRTLRPVLIAGGWISEGEEL